MMPGSHEAAAAFLADVAEYVTFLRSWFPPDRWLSTDPAWPLREGALASAEIAYVLLRFGHFHTADWSEWREGGFVALDTAINTTILPVKSMLRLECIALPSGQNITEAAGGMDRLNTLVELLYQPEPAERAPCTRYPLLYALAVEVFLSWARPDADIVAFCHHLNLIASCRL